MEIHLAKPAANDLYEVEKYISEHNPRAALLMVQQILNAIENLSAFPNIGRVGRVPNTRELIISNTPFIVSYQIRNNEIFVLRILHGARKWSLDAS